MSKFVLQNGQIITYYILNFIYINTHVYCQFKMQSISKYVTFGNANKIINFFSGITRNVRWFKKHCAFRKSSISIFK